ncbi:MAG TPA: DUF4203 domain-containing protein [Opitutaceae bacterium]
MDLNLQATQAGAGLLILWGLLDCFFGYRVFKFTVVLLGIAAGAVLGHQLCIEILGITGDARWIGLAIGAIVGGALAIGLYLVGVFILGFSLGFMFVPAFWQGSSELALLAIGVGAGLVCGIIAVVAQRLLISACTAWSGAIRVVLGVAFFSEGLDWSFYAAYPQQVGVLLSERGWMLVVFLALGAAGFIAQLAGSRGAKPKEAKK